MKKKEINKRLNDIILKGMPDVLDNVLNECEKKGLKEMKKEETITETQKINWYSPKYTIAFATVLICILTAGILYFKSDKVDTIIELDVNPSIEIKTDKNKEIIEAVALNDDGKKVLEGMNLKSVELNVGMNAIIGSMLKNGYITDMQNSILISVRGKNKKESQKLEKELSTEIEKLISAKNIESSVLSQTYNEDTEIEKLAKEYNISVGKASLIDKIIKSKIEDSKNNIYEFESLSKLSINELKLLLESKNAIVEEVSSIGEPSQKSLIGTEQAKSIALSKAGLSTASQIEIELDTEKGVLIYEVEFKSNGNEYEYDINAKTGEIVYSHIEKDDDWDDRYDD